MIDFPININGVTIQSKDVFGLCRTHTARGTSDAIAYIMNETGCTQQEAAGVVEDILRMDTMQKTPPPIKRDAPAVPKETIRANIPRCPVCGSQDIKRISSLRRYINLQTAGLHSDTLNKQMECKSCGYKF